jgi:hypothetical protein
MECQKPLFLIGVLSFSPSFGNAYMTLWEPNFFIVLDQVIHFEEVELEPNLSYSEYPIQVLDQKDRVTRS